MVIHAVDYSRQDGLFATSELDFFLGKNFLVTYHEKPLRNVSLVEERALKGTMGIARAPDRVAHSLLDALVDNYKPALDELSLEIAELEQTALQHPSKQTLNKILQIKKEVLHLRQIIGPQCEVLARFARGRVQADPPASWCRIFATFMMRCPHRRTGARLHGFAHRHFAGLSEHVVQPDRRSRQAAHAHHRHHHAVDDDRHLVWDEFSRTCTNCIAPHGYLIATGCMVVSTVATYLYFKMKKWF